MLNVLNYPKELKVNGVLYPNSAAAYEALKAFTGDVEIVINVNFAPAAAPTTQEAPTSNEPTTKYRIHVKQYMTQKAAPGFDFMSKFNQDNPMPLRVMVGEVIGETKGMYQMKLNGEAEMNAVHCMRCNRELKHPTSRFYGIGPECIKHVGLGAINVQAIESLDGASIHETMNQHLQKVTWTGWVIKSAITSMEVV